MARNFADNKQEVLAAFYEFIRLSDGQIWITASDLSPLCDRLISTAYIAVILQSLQKDRLVRSEHHDDQKYYSLTDKGIVLAENFLEDSGKWADLEAKLQDQVQLVSAGDAQDLLDVARERLGELDAALERGNDLGEMSEDEVSVARKEVSDILSSLDQKKIRPSSLAGKAKDTLAWIGERTAGTVVAELAKKALTAILNLLGFFN